MIRILVVARSPSARASLAAALAPAPDIAVVGEAADGAGAVRLALRLGPDLMLLDPGSPSPDGLDPAREVMALAPLPIVVVAGAGEAPGRDQVTAAGALDLVARPVPTAGPGSEASARRLASSVRAMAGMKVVRRRRPREPWVPTPEAGPGPTARVVAIGTSTGGPAALRSVLGALPRDFAAPVLIVQHMSMGFVAGLAAWLDSACALRVKLAECGERAEPGTAYLAPDDRHLAIAAAALRLDDAAPLGGFRPSADALFSSAASAFGGGVTAVILTGMGEDGVDGLRAVRRGGGRAIAQDEPTSVVFGMPGAAIAAGLADLVLPLGAIGPHLASVVGGAPVAGAGAGDGDGGRRRP